MRKYLILAGLVLIVLVGLIIYAQKDTALAGWVNAYVKTSTSYQTTIGMTKTGQAVASSTQVLAANTERAFARCYNRNNDGFDVSIMLGSTATSSYVGGLILTATTTSPVLSYFEINLDNPFVGAVYAYAQSTSTVVCVEN